MNTAHELNNVMSMQRVKSHVTTCVREHPPHSRVPTTSIAKHCAEWLSVLREDIVIKINMN